MTPDERKMVAALRRHLVHVSKLLNETYQELPWYTDGTYDALERKVARALERSATLLDSPKLNPYAEQDQALPEPPK